MKRRDAHSGDSGQTGLTDGSRVSKSSARMAAVGAADELNAALGVARSICPDEQTRRIIESLQRDLLALGALLAQRVPVTRASGDKAVWSSARIERLDDLIEATEERLGPLRSFVLPGGSPQAASLQWTRTVCRRAEREVVALAEQEELTPSAGAYLNRLSDLLFVLARHANQREGVGDEQW